MNRIAWPCLSLAALLLAAGATSLRAGEDVPPRKGAAEAGDEDPAIAKRVRQLQAKRKAGEELTPEEKAFLEQNARSPQRMAKRLGDGPGGGGFVIDAPKGGGPMGMGPALSGPDMQALLAELNVVDRAALAGALALAQTGKRDEALSAADKVAQKSPDHEAAGIARLIAGRINLEKGDAAEASKALRGVTGRAAGLALVALVEPVLREGRTMGVVEAFKDLLAAQNTGLDRCRVLKALLDLLDSLGPKSGLPPQARAEVFSGVAGVIAYEEALAAKEALAKERPAVTVPFMPGPPQGGPFGPLGPLGPLGAAGGPMKELLDVAPELAPKLREMRDLPPEQRKEALAALHADLEKKIDELTKAGKADQAARLREFFDRLENRGKDVKGPVNLKGRRDPAQLKAEIKKLEDQGFQDEANKLRKELDALEQKTDEKF